MATNGRVFLAGVGTTFVILVMSFGGGLILARTSAPPHIHQSAASLLPPVRVILPASAEPAMPPQEGGQIAEASEIPLPATPVKEVQQAPEKDKQIDRAERRKAEAEERLRRKKLAERKARREAARIVMRQQEQQPQQQAAIVAFGQDHDQPRSGGGFFGN
jgi:hypothetical protein